jgi:hypothetical protein
MASAPPAAEPLASIPAGGEGTTSVPKTAAKTAAPAGDGASETATLSPAPAPAAPATDEDGWASSGAPAPAATASAPQGQGKFADDALFGSQPGPQAVAPGANTGVGNDLDFSSLGATSDADQLVARGRADPAAGSGDDGWATIPDEPDAYAVPTVDGLAPNGEMYVGTGNAGWGKDAVAAAPPRLLPASGQAVPVPPADIPDGTATTAGQPATLGERLRTIFNKPKG